MTLDHFTSFLKKFNTLTVPNETVRRELSSIIQEKIGKKILIKDIIIKNDQAILRTSAIIKNEVFLRKESILKDLTERTQKTLIDIR